MKREHRGVKTALLAVLGLSLLPGCGSKAEDGKPGTPGTPQERQQKDADAQKKENGG